MNDPRTESSRQVVVGFYDAAYGGDFDGAMRFVDGDIAVHEPPYLPYRGTYRGIEGFRALGGRIAEFADASQAKVEFVVVDGDRAFVSIRCPDRKGNPLRLAEELVIRGGKIVELTVYYHDAGSLIHGG